MKNQWMWLVLMLTSTTALAFGEPGRWSEGWRQGQDEYMAVVDKQNSLYISCSEDTKVFMMATVDGVEYGESAGAKGGFTLMVAGNDFFRPYDINTQSLASDFYFMWNRFRDADTIIIKTEDGKRLILPTQDADKVLPTADSPEFTCLKKVKRDLQAAAQANKPKAPPAPVLVTTPLSSSTFDVSWNWDEFMPNVPMKVLQVVSRSDNITIHKAVVNRGQCTNNPHRRLPLTLKFGGAAKFIIPENCNILELNLFTDQGQASYQFNTH
ncbi:hypothetical protein OB934_23285 [Aeromonas salmonicida]|uniref:hypothetical protein n=1 Tax=Aeromonas salmonicida TaxID=645 RepID=UPI00259EE07F|nr:hypothetical protein [Aeromonas salmonicida]MDM5065677.1 hypothetical protein [Aeromonas salmonicida]